MTLHDGLDKSLEGYLDWSKPRRACFIGLLLSLLRIKQVNLTQLALGFESDTDVLSRYRRLQRFFSEMRFNYDGLARLIVGLFALDNEKYYLALDRTHWRWGRCDLNILFLGIVYKGLAIPVYWVVLNKRGNRVYFSQYRACLLYTSDAADE